jgi:hypothetical protein
MILRLLAAISLLVLVYPSIVALWIGLSTHWFYSLPLADSTAARLTGLIEEMSGPSSEVSTTLLAVFPPIAFCLAYAGEKSVIVTRFGVALLICLLTGAFVGTALAANIAPGTAQLICDDSDACAIWLSNKCGESGRQCMTFLLLTLGFSQLTK